MTERLYVIKNGMPVVAGDHLRVQSPASQVPFRPAGCRSRGRAVGATSSGWPARWLAVAVLVVPVALVLNGPAFYVALGLLSGFGIGLLDEAIRRARFWSHHRQCSSRRPHDERDMTAVADVAGVLR
ncbi:MAG: hypothetical protein GEV09_11070 [Pseudonocardiaceae bacterium]|nr:hypothetical protein [Pseudonocardiaceae bacterium]